MSYPVEISPLNEYLVKRRNLALEEAKRYYFLANEKLTPEEKNKLRCEVQDITTQRTELRTDYALPARSFDVYLSKFDLEIEKYEQENPKPKKSVTCQHERTDKRLKTHRDGSEHIVTQCLDCGRVASKGHKKVHTKNWQALPPFDEQLYRFREERYNSWWENLSRLIDELTEDDEKRPTFDFEEFQQLYEKENPKPLSSYECKHIQTKLTSRSYSPTNVQFVIQCTQCGKHLKCVPKKAISSVNVPDPFDTELEQHISDLGVEWYREFAKALKQAREAFNADILKKIESKELVITDNSTFGTYYSSIEWKRTRQRILMRDNYQCQSCGSKAQCVHHIVYDRLGRENDLDLISMCNNCHDLVHAVQDCRGIEYRLTPKEIADLDEILLNFKQN